MVIILCPGYEAAVDAYYRFVSILSCFERLEELVEHYDYGLEVITDVDLTYIFIDEAFQYVVEKDLEHVDTEWFYMDEFFYDIYNEDPPWNY